MARLEEITNAKAIQDVKNLAKELKGVANASDELTLSQKELTQMVSKVVDSLKDEALKGKQLKEAKLALRKAAKDSIELDNKVVKTQKDLLKIDDKRSKQIIKNKQLLQDKTKAVKDEIKANKLVKGSLDAMAARIKELNALKKREVVATKEGKAAISKYNKEINKLNKTMTRYASAEGRRTKGIGKYTQHVLKAYAAIMVVVGGVRIMTREFAKSVKVFAQYTLIMSKLRAVSGATGEEMMALKQQARDLGATTEKTATQVGELQVSLSKLGVKPKGIIETTKSILNLSTAAGEDLAESGRIAIATLKGFDKPMKESSKIVDVMAKSFSSSALDLEKYDTAMSKIAPMAALAGDSIEVVTGRMSVLADRSIESSIIGTSLRNMYIENAKAGLTFAEGLQKVKESTDQTTTASELYGKRAATVAIILANNITKTNELTKSYENAAGAAAKMAEIMRDNLQGDADKFNSAIEGLRLNLMDKLAPSLRSVTQFATNFIDGLNKITEVKLSDKLREQNTEVNILMRSLMSSNLTEAETLSLKLKINAINPDLIKGYENTADKVAFLRDRMNEYNTSMERQILLEKLSEDSKDKLAEKAEAFMDMEDEKLKQQGLILEGRKMLNKTQLEEIDNEKDLNKQILLTAKYLKKNQELRAHESTIGLARGLVGKKTKTDTSFTGDSYDMRRVASGLKSSIKDVDESTAEYTEASKLAAAATTQIVDRMSAYDKANGTTSAKVKELTELTVEYINIQSQLAEMVENGTSNSDDFYNLTARAEAIKEVTDAEKEGVAMHADYLESKNKDEAQSKLSEAVSIEFIKKKSRAQAEWIAQKRKDGVSELDIERLILTEQLKNMKILLSVRKKGTAEYIQMLTQIKDAQSLLAINAIKGTTTTTEARKTELSDMVGLAGQASQLLAQGFSADQQARDDRMLQISEQRNKELADENLTTSEKARINEKYNKKLGKIQAEQWKAKQEADATMVVINTLLAISGTWAGYASAGFVGTPIATAQSLMLTALGAMQYDQIKSQKMPKFYQEGTRGQFNTPDYFMTSENKAAGRELVELKTGETFETNKPTIFQGDKFKGARVHNKNEFAAIRRASNENVNYTAIDNTKQFNELNTTFKNGINSLNKTLNKQKNVTFTDRTVAVKTNNHTSKYLQHMQNID